MLEVGLDDELLETKSKLESSNEDEASTGSLVLAKLQYENH